MPDICMCMNDKCKHKKDCYRYNATPDEHQSYSNFKNSRNEENGYKMFWRMKIAE